MKMMRCFMALCLAVFVAVLDCEAQFVNEQQAQARVRAFVNGSMKAQARGRFADGLTMTATPAESRGDKTLWDLSGRRVAGGQHQTGFYIMKPADGKARKVSRPAR